jgi:hypothetical protein
LDKSCAFENLLQAWMPLQSHPKVEANPDFGRGTTSKTMFSRSEAQDMVYFFYMPEFALAIEKMEMM